MKKQAGSLVSKDATMPTSVPVGDKLLKHVPGTKIQTYLGGNQPSEEGNMNMDYEITAFILKEGIPFSKVESPHLARLIKLAKTVTNDYKPPNRKKLLGCTWMKCTMTSTKQT